MGRCYNTAILNAPVARVWDTIKDFHELSWAAGVVEKTDIVGDKKGNQIGAQRVLNDAFHETLLGLNDNDYMIEYAITDGPGPVAKDEVHNYVGTVRLYAVTDTDQTFIEWQSSYDSPNSSAVGELCNPVYVGLLGALKKNFQ